MVVSQQTKSGVFEVSDLMVQGGRMMTDAI